MGNNITVNANTLKSENMGMPTPTSQAKDAQPKIAGIGIEGAGKETTRDTVLNISKEAKIRLSHRTGDAAAEKKTAITSAKEYYETEGQRDDPRNSNSEIMRLLDPKAHEKWREICDKYEEECDRVLPEINERWNQYIKKICEYRPEFVFGQIVADPLTESERKDFEYLQSIFTPGSGRYCSEKAEEYWNQATRFEDNWFWSHIYTKEYQLLLRGGLIGTTLDTLRNIYSDEEHDVSFGFYAYESDPETEKWLDGSKFNVLLPSEMLKNLALIQNMREKNRADHELDRIIKAVDEIKDVEKKYEEKKHEENLEDLRFGVKFLDDGSVTYHAKYKGCEEKDGIVADSGEELLEKLLEKLMEKP